MNFQTTYIAIVLQASARLVGLALILQGTAISICFAGDREDLEKAFSYKSLLARSGKPDRGLVLGAWINSDVAAPNAPITIVMSIKNVRDKPNEFQIFEKPFEPEVFVRDEDGKPAKMTEEGRERYKEPWWERTAFRHNPFVKLGPGEAVGATFELTRYFKLDKPGNYTLMLFVPAVRSIEDLKNNHDLLNSGMLVTRPLMMHVRASAGVNHKQPSESAATKRTHDAKQPTDTDWTSLLVSAGTSVGGCILEAIDSPIDPEKGNLVVSLICRDAAQSQNGMTTLRVPYVADFRILVRDQFGQPVASVAPDPTGPPQKAARGGLTSMFPGDAIGMVLPLKKRFDLKVAGEYSVLVSLKSRIEGKAGWTANPTTVRIGADLSAPKQKE